MIINNNNNNDNNNNSNNNNKNNNNNNTYFSQQMTFIPSVWGSWVLVAVCAWACVGVGVGEGVSICPCELIPAYENLPGGGEGNLMWNCRNRLLPEVPVTCWTYNPNVTQVIGTC